MVRYSQITNALEKWLLAGARKCDFLKALLDAMTGWIDRGTRKERFGFLTPTHRTQGYEAVAVHIKSKACIPAMISAYIAEIIELRTFVSDWHDNLRVSEGFKEDCGIQEKTEQHRAFVAMLVRVRCILSEG